MTSPINPTPVSIEDLVARALADVELARTEVVRPANGARPYSYVTFAGARIEFQQLDSEITYHAGSPVYDAATGKAAAQAQRINDLLFEVAKRAAIGAAALETLPNFSNIAETPWPDAEPQFRGELTMAANESGSEMARVIAFLRGQRLFAAANIIERNFLPACAHNYITITETTRDIPVPYRFCSKCGDIIAQGIEGTEADETRSGSAEGESQVTEGHAPEGDHHD